MSYTIKMWDKTEIVIDDKSGEIIKKAKLDGIESVEIQDNVYATSSIAQITRGGVVDDRSLPAEKKSKRYTGNYILRWQDKKGNENKKVYTDYITAQKALKWVNDNGAEAADIAVETK